MALVLILLLIIGFIVFATVRLRLSPFLVLLLAALLAAFAYGLPLQEIESTLRAGFGNIMGSIGLVIVLGTLIGVILERSGAAIVLAQSLIRVFGARFPSLTLSLVGFLVSIPVFCDSAFIILNSLRRSVARSLHASPVMLTVALSTGLFATHTLVPPTPGPIAAAANLGLEDNLGLVILAGLGLALLAALTGLAWAHYSAGLPSEELHEEDAAPQADEVLQRLPSATASMLPLLVPIALICVGSIANYPGALLGAGLVHELSLFLGKPLIALSVGVLCALPLLRGEQRLVRFSEHTQQALLTAAPILLVTGAGGAFGAVLAATPIGDYLGSTLSTLGIGVFMPFVVAAALKTAQGSSTVAMVAGSALVAPLLPQIGLDSTAGEVLAVMAIGAGAMTVSHANDSYFWVVAQCSRMSVATAYRAHTTATLLMGLVSITVLWLVSLIVL